MNTLPEALTVILIVVLFSLPAHAERDEFLTVKERVTAELMKAPVDDDRIEAIMDEMNEDGSFRDINYLDLSRTAGFPQRRHTYNLVDLARAYKEKTSSHYKNKMLKLKIDRALL